MGPCPGAWVISVPASQTRICAVTSRADSGPPPLSNRLSPMGSGAMNWSLEPTIISARLRRVPGCAVTFSA